MDTLTLITVETQRTVTGPEHDFHTTVTHYCHRAASYFCLFRWLLWAQYLILFLNSYFFSPNVSNLMIDSRCYLTSNLSPHETFSNRCFADEDAIQNKTELLYPKNTEHAKWSCKLVKNNANRQNSKSEFRSGFFQCKSNGCWGAESYCLYTLTERRNWLLFGCCFSPSLLIFSLQISQQSCPHSPQIE